MLDPRAIATAFLAVGVFIFVIGAFVFDSVSIATPGAVFAIAGGGWLYLSR